MRHRVGHRHITGNRQGAPPSAFDQLDVWSREIDGLVTFGRQGLFAHDNTHHAMAMAYAVAEVHAYRGENDAAFEWLRRFAAADPADCKSGRCWPAAWVPALPLLRPLRRDPRWQAVMVTPAPPLIKQARR